MTTGKGNYLHRKKKMARNSILVPFLFVFILFQSNIAKAAGHYRLEGKKSSWQEANMTCDLSTPDIQFENEEILIKPNSTISSLLNKGVEAWVGYVKDYIYTELKGCMKDEDMSMDIQPNLTEPYQCTYVCIHASFFELTKTEENTGCICLNDTKKNLLQQGCTIKCDEPDLLCGSEKSLAIYENEPHGQRASTVRQYGYVYNSGNKLYLLFANSTETKPKAICDTEKLSPETLPKATKAGAKLTKGTAASGATLSTLPLNATTKTKTIATITAVTTKLTTGTKLWTTTTAATTTGSIVQSNNVTNTGQYRLERKKGSWQDAKDYCNLSIPDIQFEKEKIIIKPSAAISSLLKEEEEAWIGYVKDFIYVELKGCTNYNDEPIIIEPNITKPYQCAYVCRHARFFGLTMFKGNMRCICLNNTSNNLLEDHCTITCHESDLLCGRRKRYAIYEDVSNDEMLTGVVYKNWTEPSAMCLANHKMLYMWEKCSVPLRPICSTKAGFSSIALTAKKWYKAATNCLQQNSSIQPYTKNVTDLNTKRNKYMWTANTRFMHIFGDNERYGQNASAVRQYGYVFKINNTLYLRFANSTETKRKAVCDEDPVIPPKPVAKVTTQITTAKTTVIASETTEEGTRNGHSNSVTMIMLLIVVLVILPAVAGSVWFIMKWKYGRNSKPGDKEEIPLDNQFVKTAEEPEEDVEYEEIDFDDLIGNTCNQAVASIQVNVETEIRDNLNYTDLTCGEGNASVNYFIPEKNKPTDKDDTKMAGMSNVTCGERNVSANSFILEKNKLAKGGDTKIAGMSNVIWIEGNAAANDFIPEKNEPANGNDTKMAGMSSVTNGERNVSASANYFILEKNELTNEDGMELAAKSCIDVTTSQLHIYDKTGGWNSNEHYDVIGKINKIALDEQQNLYDTTKNVALRYNSENRTEAMTDTVKDKVDNSDYNEVDITYGNDTPKGAGQELSDSGDTEDIVQATHNMQTDL